MTDQIFRGSKLGWIVKKIKRREFSSLFKIGQTGILDPAYLGRVFTYLLVSPLSVLILAVLYSIKPFVWVRVGCIYSSRIGHLGPNTDLFLRRRQLGLVPTEKVYYCFVCNPREVSNRQLLRMFGRVVPVWNRVTLFWLYRMMPLLRLSPFHQTLENHSNEYYEFNRAGPSISFTAEEVERGEKELKKMGMDPAKDSYVCIFARDSVYLKEDSSDPHFHRNNDIDSYQEAVRFLLAKNLFIVRMGSRVEKPMTLKHPRVIDYAVSELQSDFMDIFLTAHCRFFLGDTAGIAEIPYVFDVPSIKVNQVPFGGGSYGKNCLIVPKKLRSIKTGKPVPFYEGLALGADWEYDGNKIHALGLEYVDNSPRDILNVVREMWERLEGNFRMTPEEERLMQDYFEKFWSGVYSSQNRNPVGLEWLKENKELYFQDQAVVTRTE